MAATSLGVSFPGHTLVPGSPDATSILAVQARLNALGCGPVAVDGVFGPETLDAIELFQARSVDARDIPLRVDGQLGPLTWSALFGSELTPGPPPASALLADTLVVAAKEIGIREDPLGSNRGPRIDQYLRSAGLDPTTGSYPWCAAFVYWCFDQAAGRLAVRNPVVKTTGVLDHWNRAGSLGIPRLSSVECMAQPSLVSPGMIFIILTSSGNGHTGLVDSVRGLYLDTIEGNTNEGGSREGIGVFRRTSRKIGDMRGFIDYGQVA